MVPKQLYPNDIFYMWTDNTDLVLLKNKFRAGPRVVLVETVRKAVR